MNPELSAVLRTLDPADPGASAHSPRARSDLARITATAPRPAPARRPRRGRRAVALAGAAALVAGVCGVAVLAPAIPGGDEAFASWRAEPTSLTAAERAGAAARCGDAQRGGPGTVYADELARSNTAVAEARGVWTAVLLAGADGFSALCITDGSTRVFDDWVGSIGVADVPAPDARGAVATDLGTATLRAGELSLAAGTVGRDVVALSYTSPTRGEVAATVRDGHFLLWLPGADLRDAGSTGVDVTVRLRDGSAAVRRLAL